MTHKGSVVRAHKGDAQLPVQAPGGQIVDGLIPSFIVDIATKYHHGVLTIIYSDPAEIAEAEKKYTVGASVVLTVEVEGEVI